MIVIVMFSKDNTPYGLRSYPQLVASTGMWPAN